MPSFVHLYKQIQNSVLPKTPNIRHVLCEKSLTFSKCSNRRDTQFGTL